MRREKTLPDDTEGTENGGGVCAEAGSYDPKCEVDTSRMFAETGGAGDAWEMVETVNSTDSRFSTCGGRSSRRV